MKTDRKITIGLISLASVTAAALIGTAAGSLAWYAYSRTGDVSFKGTSVASSALLNVGLVDDGPNYALSSAFINAHGLKRESYDGHSIVFTNATNGMNETVITEFLKNSGYAFDTLAPVTTQARALSSTDGLSLYKSPEYGHTNINFDVDKTDYVYLPFAFRIGNSANQGAAVSDIWLTNAAVETVQQNIHEAVRVFVENDTKKFVMKPASKVTSVGSTKVGGLLDLDGDGTYDYDIEHSEHNELYYGQCDTTPVNATSAYGGSQSAAPMVNVNGVSDTSAPSTFYAKHNIISRIITNLDSINPLVAEYETLGTVSPNYGTSSIAITRTDSTDGIGYANLTVYIEGWDHSVIDKAAGYEFQLELRFEIKETN